jgi:hypothetical protein
MGKKFKYEGIPISKEKLDSIDTNLTEIIGKLKDFIIELNKKYYNFNELVYGEGIKNEKGHILSNKEMNDRYRKEWDYVCSVWRVVDKDVKNLEKTKDILKKYYN